MSVKTETVDQESEKIIDDISEHTVVSEPVEQPKVDEDKLAALKAQMATKQGVEVKKEEPNMPPRIVEKKRRTLNLGIIGSGHAGSRLAESFYSLGYEALAINTAQQDLERIKVPEANKILLDYGLGGASKDPQIGHEAAQMHKDLIRSNIKDKLSDAQIYVFCTSLGGGSGGGSVSTMIDIFNDLGAESGTPLVVITVLPMTNEDAQTKKNALDALSKLSKEVRAGRVHNLIVVDNAKIETIFSDVGPMEFFAVSNQAIVEPSDVFNTHS
jgi:cell division GTPase FtsZ